MERMDLTFPVFYQCAVKGQTRVPQYHCVNILLYGRFADSKDGATIAQPTTCVYVRGRNQIPGDLVSEVSALPKDELLRRFELLHLHDISAVVNALVRLLDLVSLTDETKNELLKLTVEPGQAYQFIIAMYLTALTAPTVFSHLLSKEQIDLITRCRNNTLNENPPSAQMKEPFATKDAQNQGPISPHLSIWDSGSVSSIKHRRFHSVDEHDSILAHFAPLFPIVGANENNKAIIALELADIMRLLPNNYHTEQCELFELLGTESMILNTIPMLSNLCGSDAVLLYIEGTLDISLETVNGFSSAIQDLITPDGHIIFGATINDNFDSGQHRVSILFSHFTPLVG